MSKNLKNKVVVITGGAAGIGYEIADHVLENSSKVAIILDVDETNGVEAANSLNSKHGFGKAVFYKCDVTRDLDDVTRTIYDTYKYVDVLINNAGIVNELFIKKTININVTAVVEWSFKYWERMRKDKGGNGGTIINIASIYGYRVVPFCPVYQASKFAVMGFTKTLGLEYNFNKSGVRVMAICPGFTETKLKDNTVTWDSEEIRKDFPVFVEKNIWQKPDSVGKAAVEVFENADSGTAWLIEGASPVVLVP